MRSITSIDEVLKAAADHGDVPGVVAMAANRDGLLYEGAFGRRALPDGAAMTSDTVFWIASMTKAITSAAAMQLAEQGKLVLDEPIDDILPELLHSRRCSKASMRLASHTYDRRGGRS